MSWSHATRNGLAHLIGHLFPCAPVSTENLRSQLQNGQIQKILLVRSQQGMGDLLLATPVIHALKEHYPHLTLHLLGTPRNISAVRTHPRLARLWLWDKKAMWNPFHFFAFLLGLRREAFDLALVMTGNAPSFNAFLLARVSGARIVGSCRSDDLYGGNTWSRYLTHWQTLAAAVDQPEYQKFFSLVEPLVGGPCPESEFFIPDTVTAWAATEWFKRKLRRDQAPIAIFLGGNVNRAGRLWKPEAWAQLVKLLKQSHSGPVVAICPPRKLDGTGVQETNVYQEFRQAYGEDIQVFDEPGLPQAAAFLKPMALFICPDGGLFHVAAAAGVPTLGLFFQTDPKEWKPPVPNVTCLQAPNGQPDLLTPETVAESALRAKVL